MIPPSLSISLDELRAVCGFASACARRALPLFEAACPADPRPRATLDAADAFAAGGRRIQALRLSALAALSAAREAQDPAAAEAARAAGHAAGAAFLHPLAKSTQVKHILGSAACAARAVELAAGEKAAEGELHMLVARALASPTVIAVLARYPAAPPGGGRVGELMRTLDSALRRP
jgi:hypothetical protein